MKTANFEDQFASYRKAMKDAGVPESVSNPIFELPRGPFSGTEAYATTFEYYSMDPDSSTNWSYEDVEKKMQIAAQDLKRSVAAVTEMQQFTRDPNRIRLAQDTLRNLDWNKVSLEFTKPLQGIKEHGSPLIATVLKQFESSVDMAKRGAVVETFADEVRRLSTAADLNAEVFSEIRRMGDRLKVDRSTYWGRFTRNLRIGVGYYGTACAGGSAYCFFAAIPAGPIGWAVAGCSIGAGLAGSACLYLANRTQRIHRDED